MKTQQTDWGLLVVLGAEARSSLEQRSWARMGRGFVLTGVHNPYHPFMGS